MARFWRKKSKPIAERMQERHERFAKRIIKQIKEGVAPWQKPWKPGERFLPANFKSGHVYRGTNTLNLASIAIERGYSDHRWGTYNQIKVAGGYVRKGEKGTHIVFISREKREAVKDDQGKPVKGKDGKQAYQWVPRSRPIPVHHVVFNVEQAERLKLPELPQSKPSWKAHDDAERVIRASGVDFRHVRGDSAKYQPHHDRIVMPPKEQFPDAGTYYQTALHEVAHATGHESRLNRASLYDAAKAGSGSQSYAREELRAEISSMLTNTKLDIGHEPRHGVVYVSDWVKDLEEQPKEIMAASREAQAMSTYMIERGRELAEQEQAQSKDAGTGSREPEIEPRQTAPDRWEYRNGERTATVAGTRPGEPARGRYLVTMETTARVDEKLTRWANDSQQADQFARQYAANGDVPTWSEIHHPAPGERHSAAAPAATRPTPDTASSPRADRDDGPER